MPATREEVYSQGDPIGVATGLNLFQYAGANPVSQIDETGLECGPCCRTPGAIDEDRRRILQGVNNALATFMTSTKRLNVWARRMERRCENFAIVIQGGISAAQPRCHDSAYIYSAEQSLWSRVTGNAQAAHAANAIKPCNAASWEGGTVLDGFPDGRLKQFSWNQWGYAVDPNFGIGGSIGECRPEPRR